MPIPMDRIQVACEACQAKLIVPRTALGRKAKCPKCQQTFTIRAAAAGAAMAPAPGPSPLDELVDEASRATAESRVRPDDEADDQALPEVTATTRGAPPGLRSPTTPSRSSVASVGAGALGSAMSGVGGLFRIRGGGSLIWGSVLSLAGAMIVALLWCVVAIKTGVELGYIAWALGLVAGMGMFLGWRSQGKPAGIIASIIAFIGVLGAKFFIFAYFIFAIVTGNTSDPELQRVYLSHAKSNEILINQGVDPGSATPEQEESALRKAKSEVASLSDRQVAEQTKRYQNMELESDPPGDQTASAGSTPPKEGENPPATADASPSKSNRNKNDEDRPGFASALASSFGGFLKNTLSPIDLVFVILAVITAYRVGAGGASRR